VHMHVRVTHYYACCVDAMYVDDSAYILLYELTSKKHMY
jgi:hypothetical protein